MATLTKTQKNDVFARVRSSGLDPRDFVWSQRKTPEWTGWNGHPADTIVHKPTNYSSMFFAPGADGLGYLSNIGEAVLTQPGEYVVAFEPGPGVAHGKLVGVAWPNALDGVAIWLAGVKREHNAPDLWAQAEEQRRLIAQVVQNEPDNSALTAREIARVKQSLGEIRRAAELLELPSEEMRRLDAGITYVLEAARRMGRKDWFLLACTVLMWAVPPDRALQVVQGAVQALQWVVHIQQHLLP